MASAAAESDPAPTPTGRPYRSPLRAEQARRTREKILEAFADLVVHVGVSAATMSAVAQRAGVAERTIYRHFANGQALLDGLSEQASDKLRHQGLTRHVLLHPEELANRTLDLYRGFEAGGTPMKAAIIAGLTEGYRGPGHDDRVAGIRATLRTELPRLGEDELEEVLTMVRFQLGAWAWYLLTARAGLSTERAAVLSARAVGALIASVRAEPLPAA